MDRKVAEDDAFSLGRNIGDNVQEREGWLSLFLAQPESRMLRDMVNGLRRSNVPAVRIPQRLRANIQQELVPSPDGERIIPRITDGTTGF